jgi:hypothetical protein
MTSAYVTWLEAVLKPPLEFNLSVGRSVQIIETPECSFGQNHALALILSPNEGIESAYIYS